MAKLPNTTIVVTGYSGLFELMAKIAHQWETGRHYGIVWHVGEPHDETSTTCDCPRLIFERKVSISLPSKDVLYAKNGPNA